MTTQARELAGIISNAGDLSFIDDVTLKSDGSILNFGADSDVTLTHVADAGLLLNSTRQLQFGDSGTYIYQSADGVLDLVSDTEVEINATTIDINGNVDISGTLTVAGALDFGDLDISNVGSIALDTITNDGTDLTLDSSGDIILDADGKDIILKDGGTEFGRLKTSASPDHFYIKSAISDNDLIFQGNDGGSAITALTLDMSEGGDAIFAGDVYVDKIRRATDSSTTTKLFLNDEVIKLYAGHSSNEVLNVASGVVTVTGELDATTLDISGDADIDGTLEADAITIDGVTLSETIADTVGAMVGSNTESGITVAYQDGDNTLDFTVGTLNQNTTGTAATVTTAAQPAITSLGTLTTLTVDNVIVNGTTIGHTGDTDLLTLASGILTVAGEVQATTLDIGGTNITSTAAEINLLDALDRGSILYGNSSGVTTVLGQGSADQVLTSDGTDISWEDAGGGGASDIDGLSDAKSAGTNFTGSLLIGHQTTGSLSSADNNTGVGLGALDALTSGTDNVAVGFDAMTLNTEGIGNTAIGRRAMKDNSTGDYNTAVGFNALYNNETANGNSALGYQALTYCTTGTGNTGMGYKALYTMTDDTNNTAFGYEALMTADGQGQNTAVGWNAGKAITSAGYNTLIGKDAGKLLNTGGENVAIGSGALDAATGAVYNTTIGTNSLGATTGNSNVAIGYNAGQSQTAASNNIYIGVEAGKNVGTSSPNIYIGYQAGYTNTGSGNCVSIGYHADYYGAGERRMGIGHNTMSSNTLSNATAGDIDCVGIGYGALMKCQGGNNTAVGSLCADAITSGAGNTAVGKSALSAETSGSNNTCVGLNAGANIAGGSNNTAIGAEAGETGSPGGSIGGGSNHYCLGDENVAEAHIQVDWTIASDKRDKTDVSPLDLGLEFINKLEPVTYRWDKRSKYSLDQSVTPDGTHKEEQLAGGFLAQDVEIIEQEYGYNKEDKTNLIIHQSEDKQMYGIKYSKLVPMLVKAVQELSAEVEELKKEE